MSEKEKIFETQEHANIKTYNIIDDKVEANEYE